MHKKWIWMMDYCKSNNMPPANTFFWNKACDEYATFKLNLMKSLSSMNKKNNSLNVGSKTIFYSVSNLGTLVGLNEKKYFDVIDGDGDIVCEYVDKEYVCGLF